jgi:hypothetical protein
MPKKIGSRTRGSINGRKLPAPLVFVVRLWKEARDDRLDRSLWRGTVSDLQGHNLGCFGIAEGFVEDLVRSFEADGTPSQDDTSSQN